MVVVKVGGQRGRIMAQIEERNKKLRQKQELQYTREVYKKFDAVRPPDSHCRSACLPVRCAGRRRRRRLPILLLCPRAGRMPLPPAPLAAALPRPPAPASGGPAPQAPHDPPPRPPAGAC